jgi:cell division protein FtsB
VAQINLLKQAVPEVNMWSMVPRIFAKVFLVALVLLVAYYGWLVVDSKRVTQSILDTQALITKEKQEGLNLPKRQEVLVRQQQLQAVNEAIGNHLYWTQLLPELARVTFNQVHYSSIKVDTDGLVTMNGSVPTIGDLDKYLQVFDLSDYNKNFSDVRVGGYTKMQGADNNTTVDFDVLMKFNPEVIQYKGNNK